MASNLHVDLQRDEIVVGRPSIEIRVPTTVDDEGVARSVGVAGVDGEVRSRRARGRFGWQPLEDLPPGRHTFTVGPLADRESHPLTDEVEIPFTVVASKAAIPKNVRVESFSRVALDGDIPRALPVDQVPRGKFVDFVKAADRESGEPVDLSFDQDGNRIDGEELLAAMQKRTLGRHGRIHPALADAVKRAGRDKTVEADVWFDPGELDDVDQDLGARPLHDGDVERATRVAEEQRAHAGRRSKELGARLREQGVEVIGTNGIAPAVRVRITAKQLDEIAAIDGVALLMLHETDAIEDLGNSISIARSDVVHSSGEDGAGVRVAVWESGPTDNSDLVIAGAFSANPATSNHSQNVHAIIRNDENGSPDGHAPGCSLYSANSTDRAALTWAVEDRDCTVVNQSFHRSSEPGSGGLSSDDLYGDWLALHWPYPLIVHAAGNFWSTDPDNINPPSSEFVNHKGYNTISVGNHNDDASAMSGSSVFRNPNSPHGDRELPEISANGTGVTADGIMMSGTSMASPAVAGVAALLQGTSATLKHWPEGCRAILLGSASRNVRDGTWWQDVSGGVDARDGSGAVDAAEARQIALNRRSRNASATRRGWDVGRLTSSDFGSDKLSTFSYKVAVPGYFWGPRHVKVALAWTSSVTNILGLAYLSNLNVDLDLKVYDDDGNQVGYSGSWDNSYEIAEFDAQPGRTYTIRIRRWSGTDSTYYGIAWTVTGGLTLGFPLNELGILRRAIDFG